MKVSLPWWIIQKITDNLLEAHKRLSEKGSAKELILLSKYILKLIQHSDWKDKEIVLPNRKEGSEGNGRS